MSRDGDMTMAKVKYVLIVLCTFSVCAKIAGHAYRHLHPMTVAATAQ
jgi:hypothetical protein